MYKQDLYSIITPIKRNVLSKRNSLKNWKYGYDKESDVVTLKTYYKVDRKSRNPMNPKKIFERKNS